LQFIGYGINDEQRRSLGDILIIAHEDLHNSSADLRRHRGAKGKNARIVRARTPVDGEDDENAENDGKSDRRRGNQFAAKRLAVTHGQFSGQPYQPQRKSACTGNRQHDDEGDGEFREHPRRLENCARRERERDTHERADHPRRKIRAQDISRGRAIAAA
jgi:hypothetical protein